MSLDNVPSGSLCVLDTNVLLYAEQGVSLQAQRLLSRIERREVLGVLPQTVWQELTHKLMLAEALMRRQIGGSNPARQLASKPQVVRQLTLYQEKIRALLTIGLGFEPCSKKDVSEDALQLQRRYGLLTNDSVILAVAVRLNADALISADTSFVGIDGISLYAPSDLTHPSNS